MGFGLAQPAGEGEGAEEHVLITQVCPLHALKAPQAGAGQFPESGEVLCAPLPRAKQERLPAERHDAILFDFRPVCLQRFYPAAEGLSVP